MTAQEHARLLGIFFLIQCGLQVVGGLIAVLIYGGLGSVMIVNARRSEEQAIAGVFLIIAVMAALFVLVFALLNFLAGWKLLKRKPSARTFAIIASFVALLGFPIGTALGIYGLWFLFGEKGKYLDLNEAGYNSYPPPPPQSWH